jgi:hypothetical protein
MKRALPVLALAVLTLAATSAGQTGQANPGAQTPPPAAAGAAGPPGVEIPTLSLTLNADAPAPPPAQSPPKDAAPKDAPPAPYKPGGMHLLITGDTSFTFTAQRHARGVFEGELNPFFVVQWNDRLISEFAVESSIANNPLGGEPIRNMTLAHANLFYSVCDGLAVGAGLFHVPFGAHMHHFGKGWINQFPDDPLPFADRSLAPDTALGVMATGAVPVGRQSQLTYAVYATDGPTLITGDEEEAGDLDMDRFHNFEYRSHNQGLKAIGGRVSCLPIPDIELGFSIQGGKVEPEHFRNTDQLLWGIDASYFHEFEELKGQVRARAEWIWSNVDGRTFDPAGALGFGPLKFNNNRNGGYVQVGYRPTQCENAVLQNTEFCLRYDRLSISPSAPGGGNENRVTPGVAYWFTPSVVAKLAYEYDKMQGAPADHFLIFQFAVGF